MALGDVSAQRGQLQTALNELERSVELDAQSSAGFYKLAQLYRKLGQKEKAQQATERFQQLKAEQRADLDRAQIQRFLERAKR